MASLRRPSPLTPWVGTCGSRTPSKPTKLSASLVLSRLVGDGGYGSNGLATPNPPPSLYTESCSKLTTLTY